MRNPQQINTLGFYTKNRRVSREMKWLLCIRLLREKTGQRGSPMFMAESSRKGRTQAQYPEVRLQLVIPPRRNRLLSKPLGRSAQGSDMRCSCDMANSQRRHRRFSAPDLTRINVWPNIVRNTADASALCVRVGFHLCVRFCVRWRIAAQAFTAESIAATPPSLRMPRIQAVKVADWPPSGNH